MKIFNKHTLLLLVISFMLVSCYNRNLLSNQNRAFLYQEDNPKLGVDLLVRHISDSLTTIYFQLPTGDLLFEKGKNNNYYAKLTLVINYHESFQTSEFVNTDTIHFDSILPDQPIFNSKIDLKLGFGKVYYTEFRFIDKKREYMQKHLLKIAKDNKNKEPYFKAVSKGKLIYKDYLEEGNSIKVTHNTHVDSLYVRYYSRNFKLPAPPYAILNPLPFDFDPDSSFYVATNQDFVLNKVGVYHFQIDKNQAYGYSILCTRNKFPFINNINFMLPPLRFITTNNEYSEMSDFKDSDSLKRAIDQFWLETSNDPERAKTLIRTYYKRVENANRHFTNYTEGWRTDRGMIYTLFGAPNILYQHEQGETWVYGKESSTVSYTFQFSRVLNPFTENDFILNRANIYRYSWGQAVETWRQGRIFNSNTVRQEQQFYERQEPFIWY